MQMRSHRGLPGEAVSFAEDLMVTAMRTIARAEEIERSSRNDPASHAKAQALLAIGLAFFADARAMLRERGVEVLLDA